jgi:hypothetical protein
MFNLNYDKDLKHQLLRKDYNIDLSKSICEQIMINITPIIKDLYNDIDTIEDFRLVEYYIKNKSNLF